MSRWPWFSPPGGGFGAGAVGIWRWGVFGGAGELGGRGFGGDGGRVRVGVGSWRLGRGWGAEILGICLI